MQEHPVQPSRPERRRRRTVGCPLAHPRGPLAAAWHILDHRQFPRDRQGQCSGQEFEHRLQAFLPRGADETDGGAELARQFLGVNHAAPPPQIIGQVQQNQGRGPQRENRCRQRQVPPQVGRVQNQQDRIRTGNPPRLAFQHIERHPLIFRLRGQAVDPRQVDDVDFAVPLDLRPADPPLHRHAGKVRHLLPETGQAIEKGGFAGIRRPDQGDHPDLLAGGCGERWSDPVNGATVFWRHDWPNRRLAPRFADARRPQSHAGERFRRHRPGTPGDLRWGRCGPP